jgi:quercetin dioxygenase-like cupin family protein
MTIERRSFLAAAIAASPAALVAQSTNAKASPKAVRVARGEDRLGERHNIGLSTTVFKVLTKDSGGALFVMEHQSHEKGGPPRHLHHNEDEWFYVVEGEYIAEIGSDRFQLKPGDSLLAPRQVAHAWAFVGNAAGRLLISFAPANKMEAFFRDNAKGFSNGKYPNDAAFFRAYDCELIGPPLTIG